MVKFGLFVVIQWIIPLLLLVVEDGWLILIIQAIIPVKKDIDRITAAIEKIGFYSLAMKAWPLAYIN